MEAPNKKMLAIGDMHCGHKDGLLLPDFTHKDQYYPQSPMQKILWDKFAAEVEQNRPIHLCLHNGDAIDGRGEKSGSTEVWSADRNVQVQCAKQILEFIDADNYLLTYGTRYHVSNTGEDYEDSLVALLKESTKKPVEIKSQAFFNVNGLTFHAKHKISSSSIPHGRLTALARQKLWNMFWSEFNEAPKADIFLRSHVHYFDYCGGYGWLACILPALQGWGTKFGNRECEGTIDWGAVFFDIVDKHHWSWNPVVDRNTQRVEVLEF